uniref:TRAPP14 N-terminal domain-containing protein n=1 Tax=Oreochromis niloticus TaxID=8128 RepID=A0A669E062_ORENI
MESQYKFFMYFPVAQISSLSDANVYLRETLQFLLVLRSRGLTDRDDDALSWKDLGGSLCALASVCGAESWRLTPAEQCDQQSGRRLGDKQTFTQCNQLVSHKCSPSSAAMHNETEQAKVKSINKKPEGGLDCLYSSRSADTTSKKYSSKSHSTDSTYLLE